MYENEDAHAHITHTHRGRLRSIEVGPRGMAEGLCPRAGLGHPHVLCKIFSDRLLPKVGGLVET